MNLPPEPLKKKSTQFIGGVGLLPETRPHSIDKSVALGGEMTFRYAVSDYFTMQVKGWYDLSNNIDEIRTGFSYTNIVILNDAEAKYRFGFIPTFAFLFDGKGLEGGGASTQLGVWLPTYKSIHPYIVFGPGVGIRNLNEVPKEWGWGILSNLGVACRLNQYFNLNVEIAGIAQINKFEEKSNFVLAPSINLGVTF